MTEQKVWLITGAGRGLGVYARPSIDDYAEKTKEIVAALEEHEWEARWRPRGSE
jgi:hypothetical protein